jgi:hypothetical protein
MRVAKKESQTSAQQQHVVNDPFDLKSKRVSADEGDNQRDSSSNPHSSEGQVSISDVDSEISLTN